MRLHTRYRLAPCSLLLMLLPGVCAAQNPVSPSLLVIRADKPIAAPGPSLFHVRYARNPRGETIGMNARYLTLSGKPWLPVMGEFHYARVPESQWNSEILKMKAAGVQIVSTYVFWIYQEEVEGQFDWSGRRNLRHFVELCAKHGMYVWLRIGPWDHGEVRNGGFPNWLVKTVPAGDLRRDDPQFMQYVQTFYQQIGAQVKGLMWQQGGPIIGVQLENEYSMRGPEAGATYILALKHLAISSGFHVPVFSITGWDNAADPKGAVVTVSGGYPDAPWDGSLHQLPPQAVYNFHFRNHVSGNMGAMGKATTIRQHGALGYPSMTAEIGGGIQDTYHRRPVIQPSDVAAMMPVMLGSGVNLYGTYMFQGGVNPKGKLTTLQESQATGYPNSLPIKDYDFQAPLSAYGQERELFRKLKVFNYFLNEFGSLLAPMPVFAPSRVPSSPNDFSVARVAVRTNGTSGFLFFNNYVRYHPMPDQKHFQVQVELPGHTLTIPSHAVDLPSGDYGIWPFGLTLGALHLRYATAELFYRIGHPGNETYYFVVTKGVPAEFSFTGEKGIRIGTIGRQTTQRDGATIVTDLQPSLMPAITAKNAKGESTRIILLSERQAESAWKLHLGSDHLLLTSSQFFADGDQITLQRDDNPNFRFTVIPVLSHTPTATSSLHAAQSTSNADSFRAALPAIHPTFTFKEVQQAESVPPVKLGPEFSWRPHAVAMAPDKKEFALAAKWKLHISQSDWKGVDNLFLVVKYDADVAHLTSGEQLLDDNFYNGMPWQVGLDRFRPLIAQHGLQLEILPRRADAPIFLERRYRSPGKTGQIEQLKSVQLIPQYQLRINFSAHN